MKSIIHVLHDAAHQSFFMTFHSLQKAEWLVILMGVYRRLQTSKGYSQLHEVSFLQPSY